VTAHESSPARSSDASVLAGSDTSAPTSPASCPDRSDLPDDSPRMEQQQNPRDPGRGTSWPDEPDDDAALFGETSDEAALRALMHDAVQGLHASPDALEHLRRAIPLRRQRRRQAALGAVAAVLVVGMAVPAVIHVAGRSGGTNTAPAGMSSPKTMTPDGNGVAHPGSDSGPSGQASPLPGGGGRHTSNGPSGLPVSPSGSGLAAPECTGVQLGQGTSQADAADSEGRVYGWFRVANVSTTACTVSSPGVVQAVAQGAADQGEIQVVSHTEGDPAAGLPVSDGTPVVLAPGQDYEVAFAFVPTTASGGCSAPTTSPDTPTPTDTATTSAGASGSSAGGSGGAVQPNDDSTTPPAGIALDHTPASGAPVVVGPVIQDVCAGTVYTTGVMLAPDAPTGS